MAALARRNMIDRHYASCPRVAGVCNALIGSDYLCLWCVRGHAACLDGCTTMAKYSWTKKCSWDACSGCTQCTCEWLTFACGVCVTMHGCTTQRKYDWSTLCKLTKHAVSVCNVLKYWVIGLLDICGAAALTTASSNPGTSYQSKNH